MTKVIDILGVKYRVVFKNRKTDPELKNYDGYCMPSLKKIVLDEDNNKILARQKEILTHEVVHGFLHECGLAGESWAENEEIVDFIALQIDKIKATKDEALKEVFKNGKSKTK